MIVAKNIHKSYGNLQVLKGIDLEVKQGEIVSIVGPSGAGKSTLLHIIGTLDNADSGEVIIDETKINSLSETKLSQFRSKNIGFVFQNHHLLPEFTAFENVCIPGFILKKNKKEAEKKAKELLGFLGLSDRISHKPNELSGGEAQRVAVARALMNEPKIVLADEPSGNLDTKNADELHNLFLKLREELKQTFVIVTHNMNLAGLGDRTVALKDGKVV
jgi:lipoprotein-releasing system ATP-binding protein